MCSTAAWFGDLGDGVHKGDHNDPRVAIIEVIPDEIRYWYATRSKVGQAVDIAVSAVSGRTAAPGELRTITKDEVGVCALFAHDKLMDVRCGRFSSIRA